MFNSAIKSHKTKAWKNIAGLFISFTLVYGPFIGILALQSSLNHHQGLGLATASIVYIFRALSALIVIPAVYSQIGSKYSIMIGYLSTIVYAACNFYPSWYTLVPGSAVMGTGLSFMFANSFTYTSETASLYASSLGKNYEHTVALFIAISSGGALKGGGILGNLVSSSVLLNLNYNETDDFLNESDQSTLCNNVGAKYVESNYLYYVLISVYIVLAVIGLALGLILLDNYHDCKKVAADNKPLQSKQVRWLSKVTHLKLMVSNYKMMLMFPLFVVNGFLIGFTSGSYVKVFISDCVGVGVIGFLSSSYHAVSLVSGIFLGWLRQWIPAFVFIVLGVLINGGIALFLIYWPKVPSYLAFFALAVGWGICNSIWAQIVTGVLGSVFADMKNAAFTIFVFGTSIGVVTTFLSGIVLSISTHLWIMFCMVMFAGISYTALVIIIKYTSKKNKSETDEVENTSNRSEEAENKSNGSADHGSQVQNTTDSTDCVVIDNLSAITRTRSTISFDSA